MGIAAARNVAHAIGNVAINTSANPCTIPAVIDPDVPTTLAASLGQPTHTPPTATGRQVGPRHRALRVEWESTHRSTRGLMTGRPWWQTLKA